MNKPICILFAAPIGASKSPIATYISWNLSLPIFANDVIRTEVHEDTLGNENDPEEYKLRLEKRIEDCISMKKSFIYDTSVDRKYKQTKEKLDGNGYEIFLISINLTKEFLEKLYIAKGYLESLKRIDQLVEDHKNFLSEYSAYVDLNIDDTNFKDRLELSLGKVSEFITSKNK